MYNVPNLSHSYLFITVLRLSQYILSVYKNIQVPAKHIIMLKINRFDIFSQKVIPAKDEKIIVPPHIRNKV